MQDKRLLEQPFRKVEGRRCTVAASIFGIGVATPRAVPLMPGLARPRVRGDPMLFAKKFCHRWRAADAALACAYHFYLPPVLSRHSCTAFPVSAFAPLFLLRNPAGKEIRAMLESIHPFDFERLNINGRKIEWNVFSPSGFSYAFKDYGSVISQALRPCVAAYSLRTLGTIVRPATSTMGRPVPAGSQAVEPFANRKTPQSLPT
jgi:hypothetical protein